MLVALETVVLAAPGLCQHPWPGADRCAGFGVGRGKTQRAHLRQLHQGWVVRVLEVQHQGVFVGGFNAVQGRDQFHPLMAFGIGQNRIQVGFGCGRIKRAAIAELHMVTQGEGVGFAVRRDAPVCGEPRFERALGGVTHQGLIHHGLGVHLVWRVAPGVQRPGIGGP